MSEQPVYEGTRTTALIDWRKLLLPFIFVMVLPTVSAILADYWLGTLPFVTIAAIVICFPTATILVTKNALSEMDRVIAEITPPQEPEDATPEEESRAEVSSTS